MKRYTRGIAALLFLAMLLSVLSAACFAADPTVTIAVNSQKRHIVCTSLSSDANAYYTGSYSYETLKTLGGVDSTDSYTATQNNPLYTRLYELMSSTRNNTRVVYAGYTADSMATYWNYTDAVDGSVGYNYFYADLSSNSYGTTTMQREHIWPQSKASYYQLNGGADLHHLRPSIGGVNGSKSNRAFANLIGTGTSYTSYQVNNQDVIWVGTKDFDNVLEVRDNVKGDIARILLYVYVRWQQPNLYSDVESSKLPAPDSDDKSNSGVRIIEDRATLLQWCKQDPVDTWEMERNDLVQDVQGNRNVFIDYPELAWYLFGQTPPSDMQTPSGDAAGGSTSATVTAVSSNTDYGTVSVSGSVITASPKEGYYASGYTVLSGTASVSRSGNLFTVTATTDCTVRIEFAARPTASLVFSVPDGVTQSALTGHVDDSVTLPTPDGTPTADKYAYAFVGWTDGVVNNSSVAPTLYPAGSAYVLPSGGATLYAVYSYAITASGSYVKVTGDHDDWSGEYLIVYEKGSRVMDGSLTAFQEANNFKSVSISDGTISSADGDAYRFTVEKSGAAYTLRSASGYYIGKTANSAGIDASDTHTYTNTLSLDADGNAVILSGGGAYLRYNKASNANYFRYFASGNYTNQEPVTLYVKETSGTRYTTVLESASACAHENTTSERTEPTCTTAGIVIVTCNSCGQVVRSTTLPATGHSYQTVTVAPTVTEQGYDLHTCSSCGNTYRDNYVDPTGEPVTVRFAVPAGVDAIGDMTSGTSGITLPTPNGTPSDTAQAYTFVGWVTEKTGATVQKPTVYSAGDHYKPTSDCTLYALYSYAVGSAGSGNVFELISKAPDDWSGEYVIVNTAKDHAMNSTLTDGRFGATTVAVTENNTILDPDESIVFVFAKESSDRYSIHGSTGYLKIGTNSTSGGELTDAVDDTFTIAEKSGAWQVISVTTNSRCFAYYSNKADFRTYATSTYKTGYLFRKASDAQTVYYLTLADACAHANTSLQNAAAATCTQNGYTGDTVCSDCGAVIATGTTIPALGHDYRYNVIAPTCTKEGYTEVTCTRCDYSDMTDIKAATGHTEVIDAAVPATCTTAGKTEGKHCSVCNAILVAQTEIAALGHSDYRYTDNGDGTHKVTCGVCGDTITASEAHTYIDGACPCGAKEGPTVIEGMTINHTLDLSADISVMFVVRKTLVANYDFDTMYFECSYDKYSGNTVSETVTRKIYPTDRGTYWYFTFSGLSALEMGNDITAVLHLTKDGQEYIVNDTYSVATYAYSQLNKSNATDTTKATCANLLRYGAAAQVFKNTRTDALVDANMTDAHRAYLTDLSTVEIANNYRVLDDLADASVTWVGKTFQMNTRVELKFVFSLAKFTGSQSDLSLHVSYVDYKGVAQTVVVPNSAMTVYNAKNSSYAFNVDSLKSADMRDVLSVAVYEGETQVSPTMQYSVESYGYGKTGQTLTVCQALLAYSDAAKAQFG